jgi:hypothetical protein
MAAEFIGKSVYTKEVDEMLFSNSYVTEEEQDPARWRRVP